MVLCWSRSIQVVLFHDWFELTTNYTRCMLATERCTIKVGINQLSIPADETNSQRAKWYIWIWCSWVSGNGDILLCNWDNWWQLCSSNSARHFVTPCLLGMWTLWLLATILATNSSNLPTLKVCLSCSNHLQKASQKNPSFLDWETNLLDQPFLCLKICQIHIYLYDDALNGPLGCLGLYLLCKPQLYWSECKWPCHYATHLLAL